MKRILRRRQLVVLALSLWGCADIAGLNGNPQMRPGQDCLSCHSASGEASSLSFSLGGTLYPAAYAGTLNGLNGAEIDVVDANQRRITLQSNGAGNFYTAEPLAFPLSVGVRYGGNEFIMRTGVPIGSCNVCHRIDDDLGFPRGSPLSASVLALDAGFGLPPPGHLYAYAGCPVNPPQSCPTPMPSYQKQIQPLMQINCVLCHFASDQSNPPDLSSQDAIAHSDLSEDRSQIAGCLMPTNVAEKQNGQLDLYFMMSPDEAEILIGWLNCGAPNN